MHFSQNIKTKAILLLLLLMLPLSSWAQLACDDDYVTLDAAGIEVTPNGLDDTDNIQCALEAVSTLFGGVPGVQLSVGDFFISSIIIENYKGYLQGKSRETTTLYVINGSIDCAAMNAAGQAPAAIKFIRGEPVIRYLSMALGAIPPAATTLSPCIDPETSLQAFIHFTGKSANDPACGNDVIFPVADRLDLFGPGRSSPWFVLGGIIAAAEGEFFGGCKKTLLGRVTINQSWIGEFPMGVYTALRGGAHVDLTFTTFFDNVYGVVINNSNQTTTLSNNTFDIMNFEAEYSDYSSGIYVTATSAGAPSTTQMVISNNKFFFKALSNEQMDVIGFYNHGNPDGPQKVGAFISSNAFSLQGDVVIGILSDSVSEGTVSNNDFHGSAYMALGLVNNAATEMENWTITGNGDLRNLSSGIADVLISPNVNNTFIGDGQHHSLTDLGTGTISIGDDANPGEAPIDQQVNSKNKPLKLLSLKQENPLLKLLVFSNK